ncbi:MAG: hypothetical protein JO368_06905 [Acidimicrobiales bacterium]|nr:hypothetical protein [Acidimicrobiales bacterium]
MDDGRFDPRSVGAFHVTTCSFDATTRVATLGYAFEKGPEFEETVTFESAPAPDFAPSDPRLARALRHLHVAAGTSYYKAAAPDLVVVEAELTADEVAFHHHLYDEGLREFAVTNGLPVPRPVTLEADRVAPVPAVATGRSGGPRIVVPIGGGKDSMVAAEALRALRPRLLAVDPHPLVVELAAQSGLELLVARRTLSPELARLNRRGARNGHVPITAIVSLVAVVGGMVWGYDTVAMAVERSASEETVTVDGVPVNHQYSKSRAFEELLRDLVRTSVDPGITYGSVLRPYSELAIARAFARLGRYRDAFCSCNTVFRRSGGASDGWCGQCDKCRFVALVLAPFLGRQALGTVMGADLLADPAQQEGFAALMSATEKPFECVGERRESAAAFRLLAEQEEWRDAAVVAALGPAARSLVSDDEVDRLLAPDPALAFPDPMVAEAVDRFMDPDRD